MASPETVADKASFDIIRYAQLWEDADVLVAAMGAGAGRRFLSICSAGDNVLALLLLDPSEVVAADLSAAQLECLKFRLAAYAALDHGEFLELMGARESRRRGEWLGLVLAKLDGASLAFWEDKKEDVVQHGAGGIGKFERYFRLFRQSVLPLIHSRATVAAVFTPRGQAERRDFFERRWNSWRWRLATSLFFSKFVMGRLGRDPAFFDQVNGSVGAHVRAKVRQAAVDQDPSRNPYMQCVLTGRQGDALPLAWRAEAYPLIRQRLDRIGLFHGPIDRVVDGKFDGFNLSDIFEYMPVAEAAEVYGRLLDLSRPGARLVYWNMMVPRRAPERFANAVQRLAMREDELKARDKAFFYSDLVIEEVLG